MFELFDVVVAVGVVEYMLVYVVVVAALAVLRFLLFSPRLLPVPVLC